MGRKKGLLFGVGINDVNTPTKYKVFPEERVPSGGFRRKACPYYNKWSSMMERCYSTKCQERYPTYIGCTVSEAWLYFSNFKKWMKTQVWEGLQLDKDLLYEGNKVYSEDTCVFIHGRVNNFTIDRGAVRGKLLIGVFLEYGKYKAQCRNSFTLGGSTYIGSYDTELEAHLAWKERKHDYALQLADSEYVTDDRVREALRNKYKNFTVFEKHIS